MTVDPRHTVDNSGTDPDKGMKTRPYLKLVLGALLLLLLAVFLFARLGSRSGPPIKPATTSSGTPSSSPH